jgi:hypothetical protein
VDINYERIKFINVGVLPEVKKATGKSDVEINETCEKCPNQPLREVPSE